MATLMATVDLDNGAVAGYLGGNEWETYGWLSPEDRETLRMVRDDLEDVRFVVVEDEGRLTLEDRETGERVEHAARWSREMADWTAERLNKHPQHRVVFDWTKGGAA